LPAPDLGRHLSYLHAIGSDIDRAIQLFYADGCIRRGHGDILKLQLALDRRLAFGLGAADIQRENAGALDGGSKYLQNADVHRTLRSQSRRGILPDRQSALRAERSTCATNLSGLQSQHRMDEVCLDRLRDSKFQTLILGLQNRDGQMRFNS
jgi:hypothetical protein